MGLLLLCFLALSAAAALPSPAAAATPEVEPNNTWPGTDLPASIVTGSVCADAGDAVDYFRVTIGRGYALRASIATPLGGVSMKAYAIGDPDTALAETAAANSQTLDPIILPSRGGDYVIAVTPLNPALSSKMDYVIVYDFLSPGSIAGQVGGSSGGADIEVSALSEEQPGTWTEVATTSTAADGTYELNGLAKGDYRLRFRDEQCEPVTGTPTRYATQYYTGAATVSAGSTIQVTQGQTTTAGDVTMSPTHAVYGAVRDARGAGLANIAVNLYLIESDARTFVTGGSTRSDGEFDVGGLPAGTYCAEFADSDHEYVTEYYNDVQTLADAHSITVAADSSAPVDLGVTTLQRGVRIEGRLTDGSFKGVPQAYAEAYRVENGVVAEVATSAALTSSDGQYGIGALPAGTYVVRFSDDGIKGERFLSEWYDNATSGSAAKQLTVSATTARSGVNAVLQTGNEPISALVTSLANPVTFASSPTTGWSKTPMNVTFNVRTSTFSEVHYSFDGGVTWDSAPAGGVGLALTGSTVALPEGSNRLVYFASSADGVEEQHAPGYLNLDSRPPTTKAYSTSIAYGRYGYIKYIVKDDTPGSGKAVAKLYIKKGSVNKKIISLGTKTSKPTAQSYKYRATLPRGKYTLLVSATDLAGNSAKTRTVGYLTIK